MTSASLINLRINSAEQFKESVSEPSPNTKYYLAYGKIDSWTNDALPPNASVAISETNLFWKNMIGGKKLTGNDMSHVIPRFNWAANTKYAAYDDKSTTLYDGANTFYVITSNNHVYKCISNNYSSNSTVEPSYVSTNMGSPSSDGYIWKYMYTLSDVDQLRFTTSSYISVKTIVNDDNSQQWQVQQTAIDGGIHNIIVQTGGTNYDNVANISIVITGDGSGATATFGLNNISNTVNSISIVNPGYGYNWANVSIIDIGLGAGATARAIISPKGGHGSDPLYELGGAYVMLNPKISGSEGGKLPVVNDYRQIAILKDPYIYNSNTVFSNSTFLQTTSLTLAAGGVDFINDESVYQGSILDKTFKGSVVQWDSSNNLIKLINTEGTPTISILTGTNSLASKFVSSITYPELEPYTGKILYTDNIVPITRNADQIEDFKIVLKF
jgi:hypothetical protein